MKKTVVGEIPDNMFGMLVDLVLKLWNGSITSKQLRRFLSVQNPFVADDYSELVIEWQKFYKKHFGLDVDFSGISIPERPSKRHLLLIIADISLEAIYAKFEAGYFAYSPEGCFHRRKELYFFSSSNRGEKLSLSEYLVYNERDARKGAYAIWVEDGQEPDYKLRGLTVEDIKIMGIKTETFAERLIHDLMFFDKTGEYLDKECLTIVSGSRSALGSFSIIGRRGNVHVIEFYSTNTFYPIRKMRFGARSVVSS